MSIKIKPVGDEKMIALKEFITLATKYPAVTGASIPGQIIIWLLGKTKNLSQSVCLKFPHESLIGSEAVNAIHSMNSDNGDIHLNDFLETTIDTPMRIGSSDNAGDYPTINIHPRDSDLPADKLNVRHLSATSLIHEECRVNGELIVEEGFGRNTNK